MIYKHAQNHPKVDHINYQNLEDAWSSKSGLYKTSNFRWFTSMLRIIQKWIIQIIQIWMISSTFQFYIGNRHSYIIHIWMICVDHKSSIFGVWPYLVGRNRQFKIQFMKVANRLAFLTKSCNLRSWTLLKLQWKRWSRCDTWLRKQSCWQQASRVRRRGEAHKPSHVGIKLKATNMHDTKFLTAMQHTYMILKGLCIATTQSQKAENSNTKFAQVININSGEKNTAPCLTTFRTGWLWEKGLPSWHTYMLLLVPGQKKWMSWA